MTTITTINGYKILSSQIYCSDLGLTKNDEQGDNLNKLIEGICQYGTIYVDQNYKIKCGSKALTSVGENTWSLSTGNFELIGLDTSCGFTFEWQETHKLGSDFILFELNKCSNNIIHKISLENLSFHVDYIGTMGSTTNMNINNDGTFEFYSESQLEQFMNCDEVLANDKTNGGRDTLHFTCCESAWDYVNNSKSIKPVPNISDRTNEYYTHKDKNIDNYPTIAEICQGYTTGTQLRYKLQYFTKLFNATKNAPITNRLVFFNKKNHPDNFLIENFSVTNCKFFGNIRLTQIQRSTEPVVKIGNGQFNNNTIENVRTSFLNFGNLSTDYFEVKNNIIKNFDTVCFNWTVGEINKTDLTGPHIARTAKLIVVENNDASNDDNWYHNQYAATSYYCFVLCECDKFIYRNNRVTGMKSFHPYRLQPSSLGDKMVRVNLALYDAYLSCREVLSENNYWENNLLLFYYDNNTLLKAKDSQVLPNEVEVWDGEKYQTQTLPPDPGHRKYYNNTYISTETFMRKHLKHYWEAQELSGQELNAKIEEQVAIPYVHFLSNVSISNWDIQGNTFNIYNMAGTTGTGQQANANVQILKCAYETGLPFSSRFLAYNGEVSSNTNEDSSEESTIDVVYYELKMSNNSWPTYQNDEDQTVDYQPYIVRQKRNDDGTDVAIKQLNNYSTWKDNVDTTSEIIIPLTATDMEAHTMTPSNIEFKENDDQHKYFYFTLEQNDDFHYFIVLGKQDITNVTDIINRDNLKTLSMDETKDLNNRVLSLSVMGLGILFYGYNLKRLILKNNVFNMENMKYALFGTQRADSEIICENNVFNINSQRSATTVSKPKLLMGAISVEPVGHVVINNNVFKGFSTIFMSPNILECEFNNNHIELTTRTNAKTGNIIAPMLFEYTATDTDKLDTQEYHYSNMDFSTDGAKYVLIRKLYGTNNKIASPVSTYLPIGNSCFEFQALNNPIGMVFNKTKWKNNTYLPKCSIVAEGATMTADAGVLSPSVFEGIKYFNGVQYNYGNSYVEGLLQEASGRIAVIDPDQHIQYAKFTITNLIEEAE